MEERRRALAPPPLRWEGRGRGDERNGTACRAPGAGRGRGGGGGWDKTNVAAQGRSFAVRRAPSPVSP